MNTPKTPRPKNLKTAFTETFSSVLPATTTATSASNPQSLTKNNDGLTKTLHVYHTNWDYNLLIHTASKKSWTPTTCLPIYEVSNNPYSSIAVKVKTPKAKYLAPSLPFKMASASVYDVSDSSPTLPPPPQIRHTFAAARFHTFSSDIDICLGDPDIGSVGVHPDASISAAKLARLPSAPPSSPMYPKSPGGPLSSPKTPKSVGSGMTLSPGLPPGLVELPGSFGDGSYTSSANGGGGRGAAGKGIFGKKLPVFESLENVSGLVSERYRWAWEVPADGAVEESPEDDDDVDDTPPTPVEKDAPIMLRIVNPDINTPEDEDWVHGSVTLGFHITAKPQPTTTTNSPTTSKPSSNRSSNCSTFSNTKKSGLNSPLPKPPQKRYYTWRRDGDTAWSHDWELIEDPIIDTTAEDEARKAREVRELRQLRAAIAARANKPKPNGGRGPRAATPRPQSPALPLQPTHPPPPRSPPHYPPPPIPSASPSSLPAMEIAIPPRPQSTVFDVPRFTKPPNMRRIHDPNRVQVVGRPAGRTMGMSRDGSGNVVARWTEAGWSLKKKGRLEVVTGRGERWELMVIVTAMALVERDRRRGG